MGSKGRPAVYTIPAHRGFADALAARLVSDFADPDRGLADMLIVLPSNRAARAVTEAFVRRAEPGLLLPRMAAVGDMELGETLGAALEPLGAGAEIPPAIDPLHRQLLLAALVRRAFRPHEPVSEAEAMRLAADLAGAIDQMQVEQLPLKLLADLDVGDLAAHWQVSRELFLALASEWPKMLGERGMIDPAERRNRLLGHVARRWEQDWPERPIIAAGISTSAPAVARLLRVVSELPNGMVVMPHLDLAMASEEWDMLGPHDAAEGPHRRNLETHPQYHLKLLLDRMGIARDEVLRWTRSGESDAPARRSRTISTAFAPPDFTADWAALDYERRSLANVRLLEARDENEEAQAIAIAVREALETPGERISIITPDRALARRISAHLARWNIEADDSAGQPLAETPSGAFLLLMTEAAAAHFAPVELLQLLKHPLAAPAFMGEDPAERRLAWLEQVRTLDLALRGPRPGAGLAGIGDALASFAGKDKAVVDWWRGVADLLAPLAAIEGMDFAFQFETLVNVAGGLSGGGVWTRQAGRDLAALVEDIARLTPEGPVRIAPGEWSAWMEQAMEGRSVRPAYGGHPRVAIYGLLEARLQQADLVICAGLNEGVWPQLASPDPWLAPAIRRKLGLPALERNIGLAAHDLASAMGTPRLLLSRSERQGGAPAIASRFLLRLSALAGPDGLMRESRLIELARAIDDPREFLPAERPMPDPSLERRRAVRLSVTDMDGMRADPFAFYAKKVLRLRPLDPVDAAPTAAWRGTMVHDILEDWARKDALDPEMLTGRARAMLAEMSAHPLMRMLWEPRLLEAIDWIGAEMQDCLSKGRQPVAIEGSGETLISGVSLFGRADRIDALTDGSLAIVDYKTGTPPSAAKVKAGFALQLGLIGLIAERGGVDGVSGKAAVFEYWSLAKAQHGERRGEIGYVATPVSRKEGDGKIAAEDMVAHCLAHAEDAIDRWINGREPFTAKLHPEHAPFADYDQLMRLDEWYGREQRGGGR